MGSATANNVHTKSVRSVGRLSGELGWQNVTKPKQSAKVQRPGQREPTRITLPPGNPTKSTGQVEENVTRHKKTGNK